MLFGVSLVLIWLMVFAVLLAIEIVTLGLTTIWFAGGALVAALLAMIGAPFWLQGLAFLVISALLLVFTRPIAVRYFNKNRAATNVDSLVGKQAIVLMEINNLQASGRVTVGNQEWTARTEDPGQVIPVGAVVVVKAIEGVKVIVELQQM